MPLGLPWIRLAPNVFSKFSLCGSKLIWLLFLHSKSQLLTRVGVDHLSHPSTAACWLEPRLTSQLISDTFSALNWHHHKLSAHVSSSGWKLVSGSGSTFWSWFNFLLLVQLFGPGSTFWFWYNFPVQLSGCRSKLTAQVFLELVLAPSLLTNAPPATMLNLKAAMRWWWWWCWCWCWCWCWWNIYFWFHYSTIQLWV